MSIEINVPDIGGDDVEVTEILVSVGDKVDVDQSLLTVEGDKASRCFIHGFPHDRKLFGCWLVGLVSTLSFSL